MRKLECLALGIFVLGALLTASREARADGLTCAGTCGFLDNYGAFTTISVPGASSTTASGINDAGDIVGSFNVGSQSEGFFYNGSTYTPILYPGASSTYATGINNLGEIVGYYSTPSAPGQIFGFADNAGSFTSLNLVAVDTYATGINNAGQIVGYRIDVGANVGFVDSGGTITPVYFPRGPSSTYAQGINDSGEIVGFMVNCGTVAGPPVNCNGAFLDQGGTFTFVPNTSADHFSFSGINNDGEVVGTASTSDEELGLVYQGGSLTQFSVPGATSTTANGINSEGEIVGTFDPSQSIPAPEPGTLALLFMSLGVFAGFRCRGRSPSNV